MPDIEIVTESEGENCWMYEVRVFESGRAHQYDVTLGFSDYDLWSRGRVAPSKVVQSAVEFLLNRKTASSILTRFDCSVIRRYFPDVDKELPKMV